MNHSKMQWLASEDKQGRTHLRGLRLVHGPPANTGKRRPHACRYDARRQFRRGRSIVEGLPLERFVGQMGSCSCCHLLRRAQCQSRTLSKLARPVQIPGYELARDLLREVTHRVNVL
jgi:hypothetical protein